MIPPDSYQIAIEAQLPRGGQFSGVHTQLSALVRALGQLSGPERYLIVCAAEHPDWLREFIGPNQRIVLAPAQTGRSLLHKVFGKAWPKVWAMGQGLWLQVTRRTGSLPPGWLWETDGFYEALGASLVHVFYQRYLRSSLPVVFNPHDLQHEHFPHFFGAAELAKRKYIYRAACQEATAVAAGSRYTHDDVVKYYQVPAEKIWTIPLAPATAAYGVVTDDDCRDVALKFGLPEAFMFYPAVTWPHKNHRRLLEAIVALREQGLRTNLVCSGAQWEPEWSNLLRFIAENQLEAQVRFVGFVSNLELRALYRLSRFVIAPSLFEQASGPMFEAWQEGVSVAASNVTSVPDQAGGAALLFDPTSVDAIMGAIRRLWLDDGLRQNLSEVGQKRLGDFSWERTAKAYRALYRHALQWPMTDEDRDLLGWDWMSGTSKTASPVQRS